MLTKETKDAIEIIKRMDLKVAVPVKFSPSSYIQYNGSTTTEIASQHIHVPSVISMLEFEIQDAYRQIDDVRRATAVLLDIKREYGKVKP